MVLEVRRNRVRELREFRKGIVGVPDRSRHRPYFCLSLASLGLPGATALVGRVADCIGIRSPIASFICCSRSSNASCAAPGFALPAAAVNEDRKFLRSAILRPLPLGKT